MAEKVVRKVGSKKQAAGFVPAKSAKSVGRVQACLHPGTDMGQIMEVTTTTIAERKRIDYYEKIYSICNGNGICI